MLDHRHKFIDYIIVVALTLGNAEISVRLANAALHCQCLHIWNQMNHVLFILVVTQGDSI